MEICTVIEEDCYEVMKNERIARIIKNRINIRPKILFARKLQILSIITFARSNLIIPITTIVNNIVAIMVVTILLIS